MQQNLTFLGIGELFLEGIPVTFARSAIALGQNGGLVSQVENDDFGHSVISRCKSEGIDTTGILTTPYSPGQNAWEEIPFRSELRALVSCADAICFSVAGRRSPVSFQTIGFLVTLAPEKTVRILELGLHYGFYPRDVIVDSLRRADLLILTDHERVQVCEVLDLPNDEFVFAQIVTNMLRKRIIVIRHPEGTTIYQDGNPTRYPQNLGGELGAKLALAMIRGEGLGSVFEPSFPSSLEGEGQG